MLVKSYKKKAGEATLMKSFLLNSKSTGWYIGDQIRLEGTYLLDPQWEIRAAAVHFRVGDALIQAGGRDVTFLMTSLGFRW